MLLSVQDFLQSIGFTIDVPPLDGNFHRFDRNGKKNGWFVGYQIYTQKGEVIPICVVGDWKTNEQHQLKPDKKLNKDDRKLVQDKINEALTKSEKEREKKQLDAEIAAEKLVSEMSLEVNDFEYLIRKKITHHGTGISKGSLVVPMRDDTSKICGAQKILPDGSKFFVTGQKVSGCFFQIGDVTDTVILAEGFATAASIYQATKIPVVVTFNCNNILHVAKIFRKKFPSATLIIAGDDDFETEGNPGRTKAEHTAGAVGAITVFPVFDNRQKKQTDFNDLHVAEGLDIVRDQILSALETQAEQDGYLPLGFDGGSHFFYCIKSKSVVRTDSFSEKFILELMPLSYWEACYPNSKGNVSWTRAKSDLIELSKSAGQFDSLRIRGSGVWIDKNRIVINLGSKLIVNGKLMAMSAIKSWYVYVLTKNRIPDLVDNYLSTNECSYLTQACTSLMWKEEKSGYLLAGWIAISRIAGSLPVRPHVWLTGGSGTGKSTVMDTLVRPALGFEPSKLYLQGGTTEAGVRQSIKADSIPIIFDEFETTSFATKSRTEAIIELLRQSWSMTSGHIVKGSGAGTANHFTVNFAALVSSIRVVLENDADVSRFSVLELKPHGSNNEQWNEVKKVIAHITEDYGERLFSRMCNMIPVILDSYKVFSLAISLKSNQRVGQQYGMLLAGYYALVSDSAVTAQQAEQFISKHFGFEDDENTSDHYECLNHLLTKKISIVDFSGNRSDLNIGEVISNLKDKHSVASEIEKIKTYGVLIEDDFIHVANHHSTLEKEIFSGTRWSGSWKRSLERIPGAVKCRKRISSINALQCISIPISSIQ